MTERAAAGLFVGLLLAAPACSEPCCTVDSRPIPIARAPTRIFRNSAAYTGPACPRHDVFLMSANVESTRRR